jgi:hypothetical protein
MKNLVILVPDKDVRLGIDGLLSRYRSLNIKQISYDIFTHPLHDPGIYHGAANFLRPLSNQYSYSLVFLDREGSGQHGSTEQIARNIKRDIKRNGWPNRVEVIVFDPELEIWAWTESKNTARALGWNNYLELKTWLTEQGINWKQDGLKPERPKEALELSLRKKGIPRSSSIFREIADNVGLNRCQDESFRKCREILQRWFPRER